MLDRGDGGKIINIASMLSFQGGITVPSYAAAKGGVAQLTKALSNEWAPHRINVNATRAIWPQTIQARCRQIRAQPADRRANSGRTLGTPEDLGGAVVFLSSRASDYVTITMF